MPWKVPLFDLNLEQGEFEAVRKVLESGWISLGPTTQELERRFARAHGASHAIAVSSGTAALHIALKALGIGPGDEVICPSLTFVATANAVLYVGATPVFADICSPQDLTISPEEIGLKVTPRTRAILVMHYGGYPCALEAISTLAQNLGIALVEDAAHAPLVEYRGRKVGTWGDIGCFSFFANKNLTTAEGGMLLTNNPELAERARLLRSHGMTALSFDRFAGHAAHYDVVDLGYNYRLDDLRAALGLVQLERLPEFNRRRWQLVHWYQEGLRGLEQVTIPFSERDAEGLGQPHIFPIVLNGPDREAVRHHLSEQGIQTSVHYPPVHLFQLYRHRLGTREGLLPVTESVAAREVTLPLFPAMSAEQVAIVVEEIKRALGE